MVTVTGAIQSATDSQTPQLFAENQPRWYAAYTCANHEKKAASEISRRGIEAFLPLYRTARRWSDRRIELQLPLFQGYVFVHLLLSDRLKVLQVPGVVRLVGFGGLPAPLPDEQMESLRTGLVGRLLVEPHPFLAVGKRVRIKRGPLAGMRGILLRRKGRFRLVVSIELIQRAIAVDTDAADVEAE
jgi:transcription termination/antitermination protein NusG